MSFEKRTPSLSPPPLQLNYSCMSTIHISISFTFLSMRCSLWKEEEEEVFIWLGAVNKKIVKCGRKKAGQKVLDDFFFDFFFSPLLTNIKQTCWVARKQRNYAIWALKWGQLVENIENVPLSHLNHKCRNVQ